MSQDEEADEVEVTDASAGEIDCASRSERAAEILDDIGLISGSAGITSNAILFVEDMQRRLRAARDCRGKLFCSEKQLEWLEAIYEKVG